MDTAFISIKNKSDKVIILNLDTFSFSKDGSNSVRIVPEGTKYIDASRSVPPISIPPESNISKAFYSSEALEYVSGKYSYWKTNPWIPANLYYSSFIISYTIDSKSYFLIVKGSDNITLPKTPKIIGKVEAKKTYWHVLFIGNPDEHRAELRKIASKRAKEIYGMESKLINEIFTGNWNPLSILLYFSMLGFVEDAQINADVILEED